MFETIRNEIAKHLILLMLVYVGVNIDVDVGEKQRASSDLRLLLSLYLSARESVFFPRNLK